MEILHLPALELGKKKRKRFNLIQDFDWLFGPHLHFLLAGGLSKRINQLTGNYVGQCVAECEALGV